jgi:haloalkane dehalogenase
MDHLRLSRRGLIASSAAAAVVALSSKAYAAPAPVSNWSKRKTYKSIDGVKMAYYEVGEGDPILFLHGNPTSSYLWRKVIPHVQHLGRCIAPDMVGMGDSERLPNSGPGVYTYLTHRQYLFGLLEELGVDTNVTLVIHDWGSAMGFNWAQLNPDKVKGIAYMESLLRPPERDDENTTPSKFFQVLRSERGDKAVLEDNMFITMFLKEVGLYLTEEDKAEYMRPYLEPGESRRPTLTWPREVPFGNDPAANAEIISSYSAWLAESEVPKLFIQAVPGIIFSVAELRKFARSLPNQKIVQVYGGHFVQEISGDAIGRALLEWIPSLG